MRLKERRLLFPIVINICFMLCACQPTPEKPHVQGKDDAFLEKTAVEQPIASSVSSASTDSLSEHWQQEIQCKAYPISIKVDAEMNVPQGSFPLYVLTPAKIQQKQIDQFFAQFGQAEYHLNSGVMTQADYQQRILELQQYLSEKEYEKNTSDSEEQERLRQEAEKGIQLYQQWMQSAPQSIDDVVKPVFSDQYFIMESLQPESMYGTDGEQEKNLIDTNAYDRLKGKNIRSIRVKWNQDGKEHTFEAYDADDVPGTEMKYDSGRNGSATALHLMENQEDLQNFPISYEQALELAQEQVNLLGLNHLSLAHSAKQVRYEQGQDFSQPSELTYQDQNYVFYFTRHIEGIGFTYCSNRIDYYDRFDPPWAYEYLRIVVDQKGVSEFELTTLTELGEKLSDHASLLPLSEIRQIAAEQFSIGNIVLPDGKEADQIKNMDLSIQHVELGYARVKLADNSDRYVLVPVWDFFGEYELDYEGYGGQLQYSLADPLVYRHSYLTINAVDGTIVNRGLGY